MNVKRISGPMSMYEASIDGKPVYLFGDYHWPLKRKCVRCQAPSCQQFHHWLDETGRIVHANGKRLDVFIELFSPPHGSVDDVVPVDEELLRDLHTRHGTDIYEHGKGVSSQRRTLRVHGADIRADPLLQISKQFLVECLPTARAVINWFKTIVFGTDVRQPYACQVEFSDDNYYARHHKVGKQLGKLDTNERTAMTKMISEYFIPVLKHKLKRDNYTEIMRRKRNGKRVSASSEDDILIAPRFANVFLMDIYLVSRLLHYIRRDDCGGGVVVAGHAHIENYVRFFRTFMKVKVTRIQDHDKSCGAPETCNRCIEYARRPARGSTKKR